MKNVSRIIPCYAADTSGVCSALYELGGMTVVHDASGCNSTYATHDEPRWYDMQSMIFISALTELDAILGNDEKLIADVVSAAHDRRPRFIAVCGSPMPMMTGVDFDAAAAEIERRSGIRTLAMHTNGTHSYIAGASEALCRIAEEYTDNLPKTKEPSVNILGATPLDFGIGGTVDSLRLWLHEQGFSVISCFAMGDTLETLRKAASAHVNLVISQTGTAAAQYLYDVFGIPYVCGIPTGQQFPAAVADALKHAAADGQCRFPCAAGHSDEKGEIVVIGESIAAGSIAAELSVQTGKTARVICPLPFDPRCRNGAAESPASEEEIERDLTEHPPQIIAADPLYRFICPQQARLIEMPHFAFSGRCFDTRIPDLLHFDYSR
ncbi:MAG: oxalate:formate antiporter [Oscillospiraceae bacterium]|nr:oxalate:formate antiporter [Oscillospiraceae bacterium]